MDDKLLNLNYSNIDIISDYLLYNSNIYKINNHDLIQITDCYPSFTINDDSFNVTIHTSCNYCLVDADIVFTNKICNNFNINLINIHTNIYGDGTECNKSYYNGISVYEEYKDIYIKNTKYIDDNYSNFIERLNNLFLSIAAREYPKQIDDHNFYLHYFDLYPDEVIKKYKCIFKLKCKNCNLHLRYIMSGHDKICKMQLESAAYSLDDRNTFLSLEHFYFLKIFQELSCSDIQIKNIL